MLAQIQLLLVFNPILAAGLAQALGSAAGTIQGIRLVSVFSGLIGAAVSTIQPESPNLARGQGGGNEPPCKTDAVEKFERDFFAKIEAPAPRRAIDDGMKKLPTDNFRGPASWPSPTHSPSLARKALGETSDTKMDIPDRA